MCLLNLLSGASSRDPAELHDRLSSKASDLLKRVFEDIDPRRLFDYHTHIAGIGAGGTNASINPRMRTWAHPFHRVKYAFYMNACRVKDEQQADQQLCARLVDLIRNIPGHGKHGLLAFDKNYNPDGSVNPDKTEFYVPNEYVFELSDRFPDLFAPTMSVHPYRSDAVEQLQIWSSKGGRIIKWLPNAMGIDPSNSQCDPFYRKMKELNLILLSHGGEEKAVEAEEDQKLGNPLLLRRALDHGVKVIVAHCAGLGQNEDLDSTGRPGRSNFQLFLRLMDEKKYEGLVFGEISAMTQYNRVGEALSTILKRSDLHSRLVNGSDYPLPAMNILIRTRLQERNGYITSAQRLMLNELYDFNPLLFDFALKRCLTAPGTTQGFPRSVFEKHPAL